LNRELEALKEHAQKERNNAELYETCDCEFPCEKAVIDIYTTTDEPSTIAHIVFDFDEDGDISSKVEDEKQGVSRVCKVRCLQCHSIYLERITFTE
jgi:hypothetical protein